MNRIERIAHLFREATWIDSRSLSIYRILFGMLVIFFLLPSYEWLADVPPTFYSPPLLGLANLFSRLPPGWFFTALNMVTIFFACLLTIGLRTRMATWGLLVLLVVGNSFFYAFGKIDHPILLLCILFSLSSSDWGRHWSVDALIAEKLTGKATNRFTDLALLGIFVAFSFFTAGFGKALVWVDLDFGTGGFLAWLFNEYYSAGHTALLASWAVHMPYRWLWEFADIFAVVFELGFFWALLKRKRWIFWMTLLCLFHLLNTLLMNIAFPVNAVVAMAFFPWSRIGVPELRWPALKYVALILLALGMVLSTQPLGIARSALAQAFGQSGEDIRMLFLALAWTGLLLLFVWLLTSPFAGTLPLKIVGEQSRRGLRSVE